MADKKKLNPTLKLVLDIGPLILFFAANAKFGIYAATGSFMVAVLIALAVAYVLTQRIEIMPLVTAVIVLVFGGLTIVSARRPVHQAQADHHLSAVRRRAVRSGFFSTSRCSACCSTRCFNLTEEGWRKLTWRWAFFFLFLAVVNEVVWRTQTTDFWVSFKLFGVVPLTFLFGALQYPLLMKYAGRKRAKED